MGVTLSVDEPATWERFCGHMEQADKHTLHISFHGYGLRTRYQTMMGNEQVERHDAAIILLLPGQLCFAYSPRVTPGL